MIECHRTKACATPRPQKKVVKPELCCQCPLPVFDNCGYIRCHWWEISYQELLCTLFATSCMPIHHKNNFKWEPWKGLNYFTTVLAGSLPRSQEFKTPPLTTGRHVASGFPHIQGLDICLRFADSHWPGFPRGIRLWVLRTKLGPRHLFSSQTHHLRDAEASTSDTWLLQFLNMTRFLFF